MNNNGQPTPILLFGGTSESSPVTAGAAALVIQAYRTYHHGASPSPALVKQFLTGTAGDLGLPAPEQGSGLLNADAAVQAAENYQGGPRARGDLAEPDLLTGAPGAHVSTSLAVTNSGSKAEKVALGTRSFASTSGYQTNVALNPATDPTFPYPTNGLPWAYKKVTFHVSGGAARLGVSIDWQGDPEGIPGGSVVRLTLIGPDGAFVTNTRPQGGTDVGQLRVRRRRPPGRRHLDGGALHADHGGGGGRPAAALHGQRHPQRRHAADRAGRLGQPLVADARRGPDRARPGEHQHQR